MRRCWPLGRNPPRRRRTASAHFGCTAVEGYPAAACPPGSRWWQVGGQEGRRAQQTKKGTRRHSAAAADAVGAVAGVAAGVAAVAGGDAVGAAAAPAPPRLPRAEEELVPSSRCRLPPRMNHRAPAPVPAPPVQPVQQSSPSHPPPRLAAERPRPRAGSMPRSCPSPRR